MVRMLSSSRGFAGRSAAVLAVIFLAFATPASAQDAGELLAGADLPADARSRLAAILDDPATTRRQGPAQIEAAERIRGNVVVVGGDVTVAGVVEGDLIVLRGNAVFEPGSAVTGDVTVVCGNVSNARAARLAGGLTIYGPSFCGMAASRKAARDDDWGRTARARAVRTVPPGRAYLTARVYGNYSRVEGLPLALGPVIETGGTYPFRLEALAVLRTNAGGSLDGTGYIARAEQAIGRGRQFHVGASVASTVDPIEARGMSDLEASLSSAIFRYDPRDYFLRTGWSAFVRWTPVPSPVSATLEYRDEEHRSLFVADVWSLLDDGEAWRPQPIVAEGDLRSLTARFVVDTRDDAEEPTRGWIVDASLTRSLGGSLALPEYFRANDLGLPVLVAPTPFDADFTTAILDARIYRRIGLGSLLNFRAVAGGALEDRALPPQFQSALGGIPTLPGYDQFAGDCGARSVHVGREAAQFTPAFFPAYGCDRFVLLQAEYIGDLGIDFELFRRDAAWENDWIDWGWYFDPTWTIFFDVGHGWANGDLASLRREDTGILADAGVGFLIGDLGIYAALPLEGSNRKATFSLRLGRRF